MLIPDNDYKDLLLKGLKDKYNIAADRDALESIISPSNFRGIIDKYVPEDFSVGNSRSEDYNETFKNVTDGIFRITLHAHTEYSDGRMTCEEFISQSVAYADKVARKFLSDDYKPPFIIALTDHDEIVGCPEIISIIIQNPQKYKNLKFVVGSEIGSAIGKNYFDLTALAFDPFNKELNDFINDLKDLRTKTVLELIEKVNNLDNTDYTLEYLKSLGFKGKKTLENRSGLIYVEDAKNLLRKLFTEKYGKDHSFIIQIEQIYKENNYAYRDIPDAEKVIKIVKNAGGFLSWTHPVRSFTKMDDLKWYEGFFEQLRSLGVEGVEANHQYTYGQYKAINNIDGKNNLFRDLAKKHNMFLSGGTDAHEFDIFAHHQLIDKALFQKFFK